MMKWLMEWGHNFFHLRDGKANAIVGILEYFRRAVVVDGSGPI